MSEIVSNDIAVPELSAKQVYQRQYAIKNKEQRSAYKAKYDAEHREERKPSDRRYYQANIDKITEWKSTKVACSCGGKYTLTHKARHERSDIHIRSLEIHEIIN